MMCREKHGAYPHVTQNKMSQLVIAPTQVDSSLQSNAKVEYTKDGLSKVENQMVKELLTKLNEQSDLVIDFSCLKKCLNPIAIEDAQSQEQVRHDFIYMT